MDLALTDDQREIREWVRTFVRKELLPLEPEVLKRERAHEPADARGEYAALLAKAKAAGFFDIQTPPEHGGMGLDAVTSATIETELGYTFVPFRFAGEADNILFEATGEQKRPVWPPVPHAGAAGRYPGSPAAKTAESAASPALSTPDPGNVT